jgi:hypothetical protein
VFHPPDTETLANDARIALVRARTDAGMGNIGAQDTFSGLTAALVTATSSVATSARENAMAFLDDDWMTDLINTPNLWIFFHISGVISFLYCGRKCDQTYRFREVRHALVLWPKMHWPRPPRTPRSESLAS